MKKKHLSLAIVASLLATANANACSCALPGKLSDDQQIDQEFRGAKAVFVAKVVSIKQMPEDSTGRYIVEDAEFVVLEVLKGAMKARDTVRIKSHIGPGPCGRSARNNPPWLVLAEKGEADKIATFSDEWLIYARGSEPYELSYCDRSFPMNFRGKLDVDYLRKKQLK
jgi:hypothetical protein